LWIVDEGFCEKVYTYVYTNVYTMKNVRNQKIRKLIKLSGSLTVSLPAVFINELKWKAKQKVVVAKKGRHLIIKDWRP